MSEQSFPERIQLSSGIDLGTAVSSLLLTRALERGLHLIATDWWQTTRSSTPELGEVILRLDGRDEQQLLLEWEGALLDLTFVAGRHVHVSLAERSDARIDELMARLRELFPAPEPSVRHEVPVTFWTYGPHGPIPSWRSIAVPGWEDIRENYPERTCSPLEPLMSGFTPARGGQLILWHGRAGTGKTYALRALAWEWRQWCEFHYIVDPDTFFGQHADYLMNVLLQPTHLPHAAAQHVYAEIHESIGWSEAIVGPEDDENGGSEGWKLLMLEDTGELLTADARALIGQGLSRFLNVVDGLIGQGLRVLVLVTTNEEIRTLHPAVARPGRCAANVQFAAHSLEEASAWLAARDVEAAVEGPTTLASLYALAEGLDPGDATVEAGFAA